VYNVEENQLHLSKRVDVDDVVAIAVDGVPSVELSSPTSAYSPPAIR